MPRPISVVISRQALRHNLDVVLQYLETTSREAEVPKPKIWAVIKADAYGHGIELAVSAFERADGLAMLDLDEAIRCRKAGWTKPILLLEGFFEPADLPVLDEYDIWAAVHAPHQLDMLEQYQSERPLTIFLKINTGMNRLGLSPAEFPHAWSRAQTMRAAGRLGDVGKMTHFARADDDVQVTEDQKALFDATTADLDGPFSMCNSAGIFRPEMWTTTTNTGQQWVRAGLCLYGVSPLPDRSAISLDLQPAQTLKAQILSVRDIEPGEAIGYGHLFVASEPMRMGVVACGYGDGYPRMIVANTPITVNGVATRILGRVSMDMLVVDLTSIPDIEPGSEVVLWGDGGPSVDVIAACASTIGYELMSSVAQRVPRHIL